MISFSLSFLLACTSFLFLPYFWVSIPSILAAFILFQRTIQVRKQLCAMEVNGDTLIISGGQSDTITDIKSIRTIRSTKIGKQKITQVNFKLDGTERKVMLLTPREDSPGRILTELKKKKKADL